MNRRMPTGAFELAAAGVLIALGFVLLLSVRHKTATYDEPAHFAYGKALLERRGRVRASLSRMAVTQLHVVSARLCGCRGPLPRQGPCLLAARIPTILAAVALAGLLFWVCRRLYGPRAAFAGLVLLAADPTFLAHARWVTNDVLVAFFSLAAVGMLPRKEASFRNRALSILLSGLACGLAQASKFTALLLLPVLLPMLVLRTPGNLRARSSWVLLFLSATWLSWNAAYSFAGTFAPWSALPTHTRGFATLAQILGPLPKLLPTSYLEALDVTFAINAAESGRGYIVFLGEISRAPHLAYFPVAFLLKTPTALLLLFALALSSANWHTLGPRLSAAEWAYLLPILVWSVYFLGFCSAQIGVRYLLPALVFGHVLLARLWTAPAGRHAWKRPTLAILVVTSLVSTFSWYPHFLPYFNEFVPYKKTFLYLADSNLDWGQDTEYAKTFLDRRGLGRHVLNPAFPRTGSLLVSGSRLAGVFHPDEYAWLRRLEPTQVVAGSHFYYRLTRADLVRGLLVEWRPAPTTPGSRLFGGLWARYYPNEGLKGAPCLERAASVFLPREVCGKKEHFSVRWTGWIRIRESGTYQFSLASDDGARLWLGGRLLLDEWRLQEFRWSHAAVRLDVGLYPIEIAYFQHRLAARISLMVRNLETGRLLGPSSFLHE